MKSKTLGGLGEGVAGKKWNLEKAIFAKNQPSFSDYEWECNTLHTATGLESRICDDSSLEKLH